MLAQCSAVITYIKNYISATLRMDEIIALHRAECNTRSYLKVSIAIQPKYLSIFYTISSLFNLYLCVKGYSLTLINR